MEYTFSKYSKTFETILELNQNYSSFSIEYRPTTFIVEWLKEMNIEPRLYYEVQIETGKDKFALMESENKLINTTICLSYGDILCMMKLKFDTQEDYNLFKLTWG